MYSASDARVIISEVLEEKSVVRLRTRFKARHFSQVLQACSGVYGPADGEAVEKVLNVFNGLRNKSDYKAAVLNTLNLVSSQSHPTAKVIQSLAKALSGDQDALDNALSSVFKRAASNSGLVLANQLVAARALIAAGASESFAFQKETKCLSDEAAQVAEKQSRLLSLKGSLRS
jgi:hypothetical protein